MSRYNAMDETFEKIELFGMPVLLSEVRIDKNSVPEGLYMYELRHSDDYSGEIAQIGLGIMVNFYGTIISDKKIDLDEKTQFNAYREIDEIKDVKWLGSTSSLEEYINRGQTDLNDNFIMGGM